MGHEFNCCFTYKLIVPGLLVPMLFLAMLYPVLVSGDKIFIESCTAEFLVYSSQKLARKTCMSISILLYICHFSLITVSIIFYIIVKQFLKIKNKVSKVYFMRSVTLRLCVIIVVSVSVFLISSHIFNTTINIYKYWGLSP